MPEIQLRAAGKKKEKSMTKRRQKSKEANKTMSEIELQVAGKKTKKNDEKKEDKNQKKQTRRCWILNSGRLKINREKPFEPEKIVRIEDAFF